MKLAWAPLERWLVWLIAAHTFGVGSMLLLAPVWSLTVFGGWDALGPLFFPRQSGIFHYVLVFTYLWEYARHRSVTVMVFAKAVAVVFLLSCAVLDGVPWVVLFSAVADGLMGATIFLVHRRAGSEPA